MALDDFSTLSMKRDMSIFISYNVAFIPTFSHPCKSDENSTLNLNAPSFGFDDYGCMSFNDV